MTGFEALKQLRKEAGYTFRGFLAEAGISSRTLFLYENGSYPLTSMPVEKAVRLFDLLGQEIEDFYFTYFPLKEETQAMVASWEKSSPREMDYEKLRTRLKGRLDKIGKRKTIEEERLSGIYNMYYDNFEALGHTLGDGNQVSLEAYKEYVTPVLYAVRWGNCGPSKEGFGNCVKDALYRTDYTYKDVAAFIGITPEHLKRGIYGKYDCCKLHIGVALKLCWVLEVPFKELFL